MLAAGLVAVVFLLLLPSWVGGLQFALFQGNEWDESNYVGSAVADRLHSYAELTAETARARDGIHYPPPYPSGEQVELKRDISWDLLGWQRFFSSCRPLNLNVRHALVHGYAEMLLAEAHVPWSPSRPTLSYDRERLVAPPDLERSSRADCQILDSLRRRDRKPGGSRLLFVGRGQSRQVPPSLLDGVYPAKTGRAGAASDD